MTDLGQKTSKKKVVPNTPTGTEAGKPPQHLDPIIKPSTKLIVTIATTVLVATIVMIATIEANEIEITTQIRNTATIIKTKTEDKIEKIIIMMKEEIITGEDREKKQKIKKNSNPKSFHSKFQCPFKCRCLSSPDKGEKGNAQDPPYPITLKIRITMKDSSGIPFPGSKESTTRQMCLHLISSIPRR